MKPLPPDFRFSFQRPAAKVVLTLLLLLIPLTLSASSALQEKLIEQFKKSATALNQKNLQDFEQIALKATGDQAVIAARLHTFLEEAVKLQSQSKGSIVQARLQGLFWYCYRAQEYDLAMAAYQALTARSDGQTIPGDLIRASQDTSKRIKAVQALIPQIAQAQKNGDIATLRKLLGQAEEQNPRSPQVLAYQEALFASTAAVQQILQQMRDAFAQQNYPLIAPLLEKMEMETAQSKGMESFLLEARKIDETAKSNIQNAQTLAGQAEAAENKGLALDAAQFAQDALRLDRNNEIAASLQKKHAGMLSRFNEITAQVNEHIKQNNFSDVRNLYRELASFESSKKDVYLTESKRYEDMASEQIAQMEAIGILINQGRFVEVLPGIRKWVPQSHKKELGSTIGRELEKQKQYELALKYYELSGEIYLINRARDLVAKDSSRLDAKALLERHKKSVLKISALIDENSTASKVGTGFFVSQDGYIITNWHVIDGAKKITVVLDADQQQFTARLIEEGSSRENDIALLKVDGLSGVPLSFGNSDAVEIGDTVFTVGNPLMTRNTVTEGKLSGRQKGAGEKLHEDTLVLVAGLPADQGNSGGPLFNDFGEVIGVVVGGAQDTRITMAIDNRNFIDKVRKIVGQ